MPLRASFWKALACCIPALLAAGYFVPWQPSEWLATRLGNELQQAEGDELHRCALQLTQLHEAGWRVLIAAQNDERLEVRHQTRRTVDELLSRWRTQPPDVAGRNVSQFAELLAAQAPHARPAARGIYADWAELILAWPSSRQIDTSRLLACELVLRAAGEAGWPSEDNPSDVPTAEAAQSEDLATIPSEAPRSAPDRFTTTSLNDSPHRAPPSGSLNQSSAEELGPPPALRDDAEPAASDQPVSLKISDLADSDVAVPTAAPVAPAPLASVPLEPAPLPSAPLPSAPERVSSVRAGPSEAVPAQPAGSDMETEPAPASIEDWTELPTLEVIRLLADAVHGPAAARELQEGRGFDALNLQIARATADPSVATRLELLRSLPRQAGIDSVGWLLHLAQDESPQVRVGAIKVLSTAGDSRIPKYLRQFDETETDEGVRTVLREAQERFR